jgi:sirohydrochlorin ferrochelatase
MAAELAALRETAVTVGYLASARPTVGEAVSAARLANPGRSVAIASYLLAPGLFSGRLDAAEADHVAAPLSPHPDIAGLALHRFDQAAGAAHGRAPITS